MSALDPILKPRSIAVIGASRLSNTIGHQIFANLLRYGFTGAVYPVNPNATSIQSVRAYGVGVDREGQLVDIARQYGMRMVGDHRRVVVAATSD